MTERNFTSQDIEDLAQAIRVAIGPVIAGKEVGLIYTALMNLAGSMAMYNFECSRADALDIMIATLKKAKAEGLN